MSDEPRFKYGDRVRIVSPSPYGMWGKVVEWRGPLAPGGVQVYKIRRAPKRPRMFIEVREDQLELLPPKPATP